MANKIDNSFKINFSKYQIQFDYNKLHFVIYCEAYNAYKIDGQCVVEFILKEPSANNFDVTPFITTDEFPHFVESLILARITAFFPKSAREYDIATIKSKILNEFGVEADIVKVN